ERPMDVPQGQLHGRRVAANPISEKVEPVDWPRQWAFVRSFHLSARLGGAPRRRTPVKWQDLRSRPRFRAKCFPAHERGPLPNRDRSFRFAAARSGGLRMAHEFPSKEWTDAY